MTKELCPVCGKEVDYNIEKRLVNYEEDNVKFEYYEKVAICKACGEELYIDELQKENQIAFENAYKSFNDIITKKEIEELLDKYSITKRTLPKVLELGELTITRYLDGYVPSKNISDLLKKVLADPEIYREYLEKNKSHLSHNVYIKSANKVDSILGIGMVDDKLEEMAEYIIIHNDETTNLTLNKILYFFDVFYRLFYRKRYFKSQVKAWEHGPVYGRIYYQYKNFKGDCIEIEKIEITLDSDIKSLIDKIIECFGMYSGKVLSYFTHRDGPWKKCKEDNLDIIDSSDLDDFACKIKNEYNIKSINEIEKYSLAMFKRYREEYNS